MAVANRMAFPFNSVSFKSVLEKKIIRVDIDENEFKRQIPGEITIKADGVSLLDKLSELEEKEEWLAVCKKLKTELDDTDFTEPVKKIAQNLESLDKKKSNTIFVCDVGNNEFWFSRAYEKSKCQGRVLASKSFGTLGSAIGKAIGAYYATKGKVVCVVGDEGFQYNSQELQFIRFHQIPVHILLINNKCARMIADHESSMYDYLLHTDLNNGYGTPDFEKIAHAYGTEVTEIEIESSVVLSPNLPKGRSIQDMEPKLDSEKYEFLNRL